ncbi:MAG: ArsR family transcriptional regulator [uncultured bacterium]|nr:MAG: ArsR family transcriptional regulator [uncultured bacterium]
MHEKRFNREIERLRDPDRIARMEVVRVVELVLTGLEEPKTLLDIGTGSGLFAEQFAAKGIEVAGLDANPEMIPAAQLFVPTAKFRIGVAEKLPFEDNAFDILFMGLLLHEVDDLEKALSEASRVVRRRLGILEWPYEVGEFGPPLEHRLSTEKIEAAATLAGLKIIQKLRLDHLVLYILEE